MSTLFLLSNETFNSRSTRKNHSTSFVNDDDSKNDEDENDDDNKNDENDEDDENDNVENDET